MPASRFTRDEIPPRLLAAKQAAVQRFLRPTGKAAAGPLAFAASSRPADNLVGVGVGHKVVKGRPTSKRAVRFYVVSKLPSSAIADGHLLPASIEGVPTDVIEVGYFRAFAAAVPGRKRLRPARPGCSVGFQFTGAKANYVMAGTFGAVVTDGQQRYILSNNHVLANENSLPIGSPIFQPGLLDGGNAATDGIATLSKFVRIAFPGPNKVDCAIAQVNRANLVSAVVLPKVGKLASSAPIDAAVGMKVHKTGRTTGYRTGAVFDVSADVRVGYDGGTATFANQVLIQGDTAASFSDAGDSGSMIVDRATKRATALLFAGSSTHTIANHMSDVIAALGVTLVV